MYVIEIAAGRWLSKSMDFVSSLKEAMKFNTLEEAERANVIGTVVRIMWL